MSDLKHTHWVASKYVLIYVQGTITYGLRYTYSSGVLLSGYTDSDWDGSAVALEKYSRLLLQYGICNDLLVQQETRFHRTEYN